MDSAPKTYPLAYSGDSPMIPVFQTLEKVLDSDTTVLIEGESGTGKDALTQWLHHNSSRKHAPFLKLDLASLPEELVESELFGYERGAFTGAQEAKLGKFEMAHGGMLALDEIANVDLRVQAKLLHVVEAKEFYRLGGTRAIKLDSRIVVLSSIPLAEAVERRTFRQDLFFRLNMITIRIPPLRERRSEFMEITEHLLAQLNRKYGREAKLAAECATILSNYDFPGNIRELRNGLERALLMSEGGWIAPVALPRNWLTRRHQDTIPSLEDVERAHIAEVLNRTHGRKVKAATILGISRKTLLEKRKKYGLE